MAVVLHRRLFGVTISGIQVRIVQRFKFRVGGEYGLSQIRAGDAFIRERVLPALSPFTRPVFRKAVALHVVGAQPYRKPLNVLY